MRVVHCGCVSRMNPSFPIAIVGAGPAGSSLARRLAGAGRETMLFHSSTAEGKHCGGGIPPRTFDEFPWLRDIAAPSRDVNLITLVSPAGEACEIELQRPVRIFSRPLFDEGLRAMARSAGARVINERVRSLRRDGSCWIIRTDSSERIASFLVGADGVAGIARRTLAGRFPPSALSLCAGYYLSAPDPARIVIGFLRRRESYAWIFPRPDMASAGIGAPLAGGHAGALRGELRSWLTGIHPDHPFDFSRPYASLVPTYTGTSNAVCGDGWALVGDAAGVAEPVTREGIFFSIASAEICASAILEGRSVSYSRHLSAFLSERFRGALLIRRHLFTPFLTRRVIRTLSRSRAARKRMQSFFSGDLRYRRII